ncbi:YcnI family copper-binding membrane protein [Cryobacterium zhongshanensis]|uniref:YcnI family protein n=1 Tax=Cryobacterium zhongshanensis TaxID=2928153 RepID=A0AA41QW95_9MICO|nr:YcnI family protein [Cryobacterium zhongshanensis]MCI4658470.1 YcnI family protein [Cryobacterium zhongshanensis]
MTALTAGLLLAIAVPTAATAHVGIDPVSAEPGTSQRVSFSAVNESEAAAAIKVEITLPTDTPILTVSYLPTPGWTTEVIEADLPQPVTVGDNKITRAPSKIVFTADQGNGIRPGQFQEWTLSLGPIPDTGRILFPAIETYDDGEVVNWTAAAEEIENDSSLDPAPVLFVNDEPVAGHDEPATASDHDDTAASASTPNQSGLAVGLGISGIVLGALGILIGGLAWIRSEKAAQ